jgi:hypothetical protein
MAKRSPGGSSWRCSRLSWRSSIGCASETFASGTRASQAAHSAASRKAGFCSLPAAGGGALAAPAAFAAAVRGAWGGMLPDGGFVKPGVVLTDVAISISW